MDRRKLIRSVTCLFIISPLPAYAKQSERVFRVGILLPGSPSTAFPPPKVFIEALSDLGYVEQRNLVLDFRWAEGHPERLPTLAAELVEHKSDVIVTFTTEVTFAAKRVTTTVPIVFMQVSDPVGSGLVESLAHPGGNITGLTDYGVDLAGKYVELIHAVAPNATRIGILMSDSPIHPRQEKAIERAAKKIGLTVVPTMDRSTEELEKAFGVLERERAGALIVLGGVTQTKQREKIAELALRTRTATLFPGRGYVEQGGLMSYGPNLAQTLKLGATYVDRILKGTNPAAIPVEQPPTFELIINATTAKALDITIPQSLLLRADEVIH